jgi:hypothetical protein
MVSHSDYMYAFQRASVSARLSSDLMKKRIEHKQNGCKDHKSSSGLLFKSGVAAVGLFALAKVFSR